jgi:hypothetical protein
MPGGYGTDESLPWSGSSSSGSSSSYEPYSGNSGSDDYGIGSGGEFGGSINYGSGLPGGGPPEEDPYDWTTDSDYGGSTYVPWQDSAVDKFVSAYGGLSYDWVDPNSDFFKLDYKGNPLPDHGEHWYKDGLWNPFIAGFDKEGKPIYLTTSQFNEMMSVGEFGILPSGGSNDQGGGGGRGGGYYRRGYGGSGGGGGGGGSRMQYPGAEGAGGMRGIWGPYTLQGDWIRKMRGYNRGGIVSLC